MTFKENLAYMRYFGVKLTFWKTVNKVVKKTKGRLIEKVSNINRKAIEKYIKDVCADTYNTFIQEQNIHLEYQEKAVSNLETDSTLKNNVIWTMWWQGEENAPELIKKCIASIRKNANGHPVIVLDKSNYQNYIFLPEIILQRYEEGKRDNSKLKNCIVDATKLSDIIRCALLSWYGGVWCDASVFITRPIFESLFTDEWSTLGQDNPRYIGSGKWSCFFMGCQADNVLVKFLYQMHVEYFTKKKYWVNYLLIDYFVDIAYRENSKIMNMIDNVKTGNKKCLTINRKYNNKVDIRQFNAFIPEQHFHKLSWRWEGGVTRISECCLKQKKNIPGLDICLKIIAEEVIGVYKETLYLLSRTWMEKYKFNRFDEMRDIYELYWRGGNVQQKRIIVRESQDALKTVVTAR